MGDLIGEAVEGTLYFIGPDELKRGYENNLSSQDSVKLLAEMCRLNTLYMIAKAGSGHIGSSFSSMEIMCHIYTQEANHSSSDTDGAIFFSSKGHDAPALYSILIALGKISFEKIHELRRLNGLPGHPDVNTECIIANTGSLGMGISKAKGIIKSYRLNKTWRPVFVLTGDGELQEGQIWESLISAANDCLDELVVIVDHNKLQSDTMVSKVSDLGQIESKFESFGWHVERCDGNDPKALAQTLDNVNSISNKPKIVIADTVKGKGVSFMEHSSIDSDIENYKFHSGAPSSEQYSKAATELIASINSLLSDFDMAPLELEVIEAKQSKPIGENVQRLIPTYGAKLKNLAAANEDIVVLDADLLLDTGLGPFADTFPDRLIECGIAEQDMVSQAGGLALSGKLPIVHSFACFLAARAREQIYNNASEQTKVIYVGSLAGILPGGPGHSHQGVSDIATLGHIPELLVVTPCCEAEVEILFDWIVNKNKKSCYLRLESIPVDMHLDYPTSKELICGQGIFLTGTPSDRIKFVAYGPLMISKALALATIFSQQGNNCAVLNFPWLNHVDDEWLRTNIAKNDTIVCLDNHLSVGGLGQLFASALFNNKINEVDLICFGLEELPNCGSNIEVLQSHGLDNETVLRRLMSITGKN